MSDWLLVLALFLAMCFLVHAVHQYRSQRVRLVFKDPVLRTDAYADQRRLRLASLNHPASKGYSRVRRFPRVVH